MGNSENDCYRSHYFVPREKFLPVFGHQAAQYKSGDQAGNCDKTQYWDQGVCNTFTFKRSMAIAVCKCCTHGSRINYSAKKNGFKLTGY